MSNKTNFILKLFAKLSATIIAGFMLFIFVGETFGDACKQSNPNKSVLPILKIGATQIANDSIQGGKWYSKNPKIAIIDSITGKITAIETGTTKITHVYQKGENTFYQSVDVHTSHTIILLTLMGFYWITLLLLWWKEKLFSILNIFFNTSLITAIHLINGIPLIKIYIFFIGAIPAFILLLCIVFEKQNAIISKKNF